MKQTLEQRKYLSEASKQMPAEAVRKMGEVMRENFKEADIPYDASHLKACLELAHLVHPTLPPMYGEFVASSILLLIRLIEEEETGLVASPIQPKNL